MDDYLYAAQRDIEAVEDLSILIDKHKEIICFHCQQAAEKMLKNIFRENDEMPERTHDLVKLATQASKWLPFNQDAMSAYLRLTTLATRSRYLTATDIDVGAAVQAIKDVNETSRQIRDAGYSAMDIQGEFRGGGGS